MKPPRVLYPALLALAASLDPLHAQLVLTEINSDAAGGDFWELTNVGTTSQDIGGWKWIDSGQSLPAPAVQVLPAGTTIAAGESVIFISNAATSATWEAAWGPHPGVQKFVGGPGLGQNDSVRLYDSSDALIFTFSYAASQFTRADGSGSQGGHAGASAGGVASQSAILDPGFGTGSGRRYTAATVGAHGAYANASGGLNVGSPGVTGITTGGGPSVTLSLSAVPATFSESAANPASTGTVSRATATASDLVVNLSSSDTTEATVPSTVTILANQTSATFPITAVNDSFPDGDKAVTITATATNATSPTVGLTVQDDGDVLDRSFMLTEVHSSPSATSPANAEDFWELTNIGTVTKDISGYSWHDSGRSGASAAAYKLPNGATIAAGESVIFTVMPVADFRAWWGIPDGVQVFQTTGAPGLGKGDGISFFDAQQNELFYFSYGVGGFTKEDGTPSVSENPANPTDVADPGHAGVAAGGTESQTVIWVPTSGTATPRYTAATGTNYGSFTAAVGTDTGSPGITEGIAGAGTVSIASASITEGNSGTSTLALDVTRSDTASAFTVAYAVTGGTADSSDFTLASGTLTFTAGGAATQPINITVHGDTVGEPDETVIVTLSNVVNATGTTLIGTGTGIGTILNDDIIPPTIALQPEGTSITSGGVTTLLVNATGSPAPTIQWYRGASGDVSNPVSGATSRVFVTPALTTDTSFWARVSNGSTHVDSSSALVSIAPAVTSVDLSTYLRVGRHNLPHPSRDTAPAGNLLAEEASGVAYNWDTDTLFVIGDGGQSVTQVTKTGKLVDTMTLGAGASSQGTEFYDPEGITYIGNGEFVFTEERDRQAVKFTYVPGTTLARSATRTMKLGTTIGNIGLEGLSYDPQTNGFLFVKESGPMAIFQATINFDTLTASNGSPTTVNSVNLFDPALAGTLDMSDVFAFSNLPSMAGQPQAGNMLIISQESAKIVNVDRAGSVANSLTLVADAGNISIQDQTHEGVTMDRTGRLYVVSENGGGTSAFPQVWVFAPSEAINQAPTSIALNNSVTSLAENTVTASAIKVADILVTDDGLGTNGLTVTGADAAFFQITGNALFLKAGTTLNHLTKPTFSVSVEVDDTSVGNTPDASVNYTLTITPPPTGTPTLVITEVASWSSGNSTVAADWFEVTNIGTATADITNWRMDDSAPNLSTSVPLVGITSIAPGESVIFLEVANKTTDFINVWFGGNAPAGLQFGTYVGSGVGLSTGGDAINLFDSAGNIQANVVFGANAPAVPGPFRTFDNAAGANNATISTLSSVGVNGAYSVTDMVNATTSGTLIGSPGTIGSGMPTISITATDATASEDGPDSGTFRVSRTGATSAPLTANFTVTGTASAADFTPAIGTSAVIPAGQSFVDITITPVADSLVEGSESLTLTLFDTGSYDVGTPDSATVAIADSSFASWLAANGYTSLGMDLDSDNDGYTDGMEFFFNQSPNSGADLANLPKVFANGGGLQLGYTRLTNAFGLNGELQVSGDLQGWTPAILGLDYTVASSVVNGDETTVTYDLPGTGPSQPSPSAGYLVANASDPIGATLGGVRVVNEGLVGVGRMSGENVDKFGETQGASSGLFITDWAYDGSQFSGIFHVLPDRGYGDGTSNYAARLHEVDFTFSPYYGTTPVAQTQVMADYVDSTKFTYQDGAKVKFTTGLNPDTVAGVVGARTGTLFGQTVGLATAANGEGGAQESLLSFDAEAIHLFPDGSGYVSDEYGTYIARFDATKKITGLTQLPGAAQPHNATGGLKFDSIGAPANGRRNNQGLEGMSVTPDGTRLFAMLQSATVQDTAGSAQQTRNHARLYVYDIAGGNRENPVAIGEYIVRLPQIDLDPSTSPSSLTGTAAQSEIVALGPNSFLMLPRDGNGLGKGTLVPITFKSVQLVDFASATNILGQYDNAGQAVSPGGVLAEGVKAAATAEVINMLQQDDLAKFGMNTTIPANSNTLNEKIEGMALVPDLSTEQANDFFLFVANDNDFQSSDVRMLNAAGQVVSRGDGRLNAGITNDAMFYVWRLTIDAGGKFFRMDVKENP
ncbi:esterase-like activity of phytase family protein [Luteolibacter flavescens]|uniref:Esterase-like activity of phytase family protein n=1 Tax=Luteolibacter flavescens TaxID=1859460 RepID=A0ABT3FUI6_9BACT|nr:SdiA-regulated domain-containing protein [Luteolibacter flavescens]MCW1886864.1 esterase-like activity of phytase family protein [Luteolibacter flavescens]